MHSYLKPEEDGLIVRESGYWVVDKLDYIRKYITIFITSMRKKNWHIINYLDLFAGPGKCRIRETNDILLGSPLIALTARYPFGRYFFVDADPANVRALRQRSSKSEYENRVLCFEGDSNKLVHSITQQIIEEDANRPKGKWPSLNLAFLDPEGLELHWGTVEALARVSRMDLIIHYPQMGISREMPNEIELSPPTKLDRFFGDTAWRDIFKRSRKAGKGSPHRDLISYYKEKLARYGYKVREIPTGDEARIVHPTRGATLYRLIFASKHNLGNRFWREILDAKRLC